MRPRGQESKLSPNEFVHPLLDSDSELDPMDQSQQNAEGKCALESGMGKQSSRSPPETGSSMRSTDAPSTTPASDHLANSSTTANRLVDTLRIVIRDAETNSTEVALIRSQCDALRREKEEIGSRFAVLEREARVLKESVTALTQEKSELKAELGRVTRTLEQVKQLLK